MVLSLITDYCRRYRRCWLRLYKLIRDAPILNAYFLNVVVEFFVGKGGEWMKSELGRHKPVTPLTGLMDHKAARGCFPLPSQANPVDVHSQ